MMSVKFTRLMQPVTKRVCLPFNLYLFICNFTERYTEIERENRILLEKMTTILQKQRAGQVYTANSMNKTSMMGGGMGMQSGVTQLKLEMHEYKEMGLSVGDKVYLELTKEESLGI